MTARTPVERAAEAVYQRYDQVNTLTAPNIARAALAAALDVDELARVIAESDISWHALRGRIEQEQLDVTIATAIRAHLLGTDEGGA